MSVQEYELIQDEDERCLKRYRKQCMQEMHERLSFGPKFESVHELESGEAFLEVIEKEHRLTLVVVHIYQHGVKGQVFEGGAYSKFKLQFTWTINRYSPNSHVLDTVLLKVVASLCVVRLWRAELMPGLFGYWIPQC